MFAVGFFPVDFFHPKRQPSIRCVCVCLCVRAGLKENDRTMERSMRSVKNVDTLAYLSVNALDEVA